MSTTVQFMYFRIDLFKLCTKLHALTCHRRLFILHIARMQYAICILTTYHQNNGATQWNSLCKSTSIYEWYYMIMDICLFPMDLAWYKYVYTVVAELLLLNIYNCQECKINCVPSFTILFPYKVTTIKITTKAKCAGLRKSRQFNNERIFKRIMNQQHPHSFSFPRWTSHLAHSFVKCTATATDSSQ